jgi:DNA-binding transcriptional LysR family regulator
MDRLLSMQAFEKVAAESGFAAAARVLNVSPATVTRLVNDLEDHLGARLIQRTTHKLQLTESGHVYLKTIKRILQEINDAEVIAQNSSEELIGTLNILATPLLASKLLGPMAGRWRVQYPHVILDITLDPFSYLRVEEFDLTLMSVEDDFDANTVARAIGKTERILCAAPQYLNHAGMPSDPTELHRHAYLKFPWHQAAGHNSAHSLQLNHVSGVVKSVNVPVNVSFQALGFDVLFSAMMAGAGLCLISKHLAQPYIQNGQLTHVLPGWHAGNLNFYAGLPSRKHIPARVIAMLDALTLEARLVFPPNYKLSDQPSN